MWLAWHCHQQSQKKKLPPGHIPHRGIYYTSSCIVSKWSPQKDPESLPLEGHWQALLSLVMSDSLWPMNWGPPGSPVHGDSPSKNTGVSCCALLQGIFPTQGSNPGLLRCRQILYHLSHQGSPRILKWVTYPFSRWSSQPRKGTKVSCIAGKFFIHWATREAQFKGISI